MSENAGRFNVQLDDPYAAKLRALAARVHMNPATVARSLLQTALDNVEPDAAAITAILNSIPGAYDRAQTGRRQTRAGKGIPLDRL